MNRKSIQMKVLLAAGPALLCTHLALAGGSIYSRFGLGDLVYFGGSRADAMGGAGIGLLGDGFINRLNPAGLGKIARTRVSGSFEYSRFSSSDESSSGSFARGEFKALAFAIPLSTNDGLVMELETNPYSSVLYATKLSDDQLTQEFFGTGGLTSFGIGSSYSPWNGFYVGGKFNYFFGRIRQIAEYSFVDQSFTSGEIRRSQFYSGSNFTFGITQDSIGRVVNSASLEPLTVGLIFSFPTRLSVNEERLLFSNQILDTLGSSSSSVDVPLAIGLGFSYFTGSRYVFAGDVYFQQWQNANFLGKPAEDFRNSTRIGLGFESLPRRDGDSFWDRVAYRAGISYHSTYYSINHQPIDEWFASGGLGIPIGPDARLNIGLHAGVRGSSSNGLQRDTIFRLTVSFSASEAWFLRFEED